MLNIVGRSVLCEKSKKAIINKEKTQVYGKYILGRDCVKSAKTSPFGIISLYH